VSIPPKELEVGSYYVVESNDKGLIALRKISFEEYTAFVSLSQALHQYHYQSRRFDEVRMNWTEFFRVYDEYEAKAIRGEYKDKQQYFDLVYVDMNRLLTNFLSSFRLYVDNLERYIKDAYGDHSNEYSSFRRHLMREFDSKFEYRFFYALRNYSQHIYFPIYSIGLDVEIDPATRVERRVFKVSFNRDKILENKELSRHIREDLKLFNVAFPVRNQMLKIIGSISIIAQAFTDNERIKLTNLWNQYMKYFQLREANGEISLGQLNRDPSGNPFFDTKEIPTAILKSIYKQLEGKDLQL
jgi:hypothetical protein